MTPSRGATRTLKPARNHTTYTASRIVVECGISPLNYRACNRQVAARNVITIEERP